MSKRVLCYLSWPVVRSSANRHFVANLRKCTAGRPLNEFPFLPSTARASTSALAFGCLPLRSSVRCHPIFSPPPVASVAFLHLHRVLLFLNSTPVLSTFNHSSVARSY